MKKIIYLSIACATLAYCADRYVASQQREDLRKEAQAAQIEENRAVARDLAARYSANYKWYQVLDRKGDPLRLQVMQADLEEQWLGDKPIVFIGTIDDYRNTADGRYQVTVKPDLFSIGLRLYDVGLDVTAPKELIRNFVSANPKALSGPFSSVDGSVVVIAKISSVEKRFEGSGDDAGEVRYGMGELLDIKFLKGGLRHDKNGGLFGEADGF